jgi:hypothetical protein
MDGGYLDFDRFFVGECTAALGGSLGTERQRLWVLSARDRRPSDTDRRIKSLEALT